MKDRTYRRKKKTKLGEPATADRDNNINNITSIPHLCLRRRSCSSGGGSGGNPLPNPLPHNKSRDFGLIVARQMQLQQQEGHADEAGYRKDG